MIADHHKFQAIILQSSKNVKHYKPIKLEIEKAKIEATNTLTLLGITISKLILKKIYPNCAIKHPRN